MSIYRFLIFYYPRKFNLLVLIFLLNIVSCYIQITSRVSFECATSNFVINKFCSNSLISLFRSRDYSSFNLRDMSSYLSFSNVKIKILPELLETLIVLSMTINFLYRFLITITIKIH